FSTEASLSPSAAPRISATPPPPMHAPQVGVRSSEPEPSRPPGTFIPMRATNLAEAGPQMGREQWQMMQDASSSPVTSPTSDQYREQVRQQLNEKLQKESRQDGDRNPREQVKQQLQLQEHMHRHLEENMQMSWQAPQEQMQGSMQPLDASAVTRQLQFAQMQMVPEDTFLQQVQQQQRQLQKLPPPPAQMPLLPQQQWGPPPPPSHAPLG
ncbi:unnamed protein product, partial [Durusdinium trenchii]